MKRLVKKSFLILLAGLLLVSTIGCGQGSGDRVLVAKYIYEINVDGVACTKPQRHDVVVFRFPEDPVKDGAPHNFIKRLIGLAGETIIVIFGQLFVATGLTYPETSKGEELDLWYVGHSQSPEVKEKAFNAFYADMMFGDSKEEKKRTFQIIRKDPHVMLAMRRIVYDNDYQAMDLKKAGFPPRWAPTKAETWSADGDTGFKIDSSGAKDQWLRYKHYVRPGNWPRNATSLEAKQTIDECIKKAEPRLITDFCSYNEYEYPQSNNVPVWHHQALNWVSDLMLECDLTVEKAEGEFCMELSCGVDRFQARWELSSGKCTLYRLKGPEDPEKVELETLQTNVNAPGTYRLRFANFDQRLTIWVNDSLPSKNGESYKGKTYESPWVYIPSNPDKGTQEELRNAGPTRNDLEPASLAVNGGAAVSVSHLRLWRDTYYMASLQRGAPIAENESDVPNDAGGTRSSYKKNPDYWSDPAQWGNMQGNMQGSDPYPRRIAVYVQPGHYLCFGDNSPESHDGRSWGLVPERLMLGRALAVYYPFNRARLIR